LENLQSGIYNNKPNDGQSTFDDSSISIHSCHTPLRELETLRNYLLTIAEKHPLDASEVLVMCPDIESYAPAIEAVFGG
jgi:exodeoxyribonuclease V gamma subunit